MITNSWVRISAWAAGLLAVAAALHIVQVLYKPFIGPVLETLTPIFFAFALALLIDPTIDRLQKIGLSRGRAVAFVALAFVAVIVIISIFLIPVLINQATELAANMPKYWSQMEGYISGVMSDNAGLLRRAHLPTTIAGISERYGQQIGSIATNSFSTVAGSLAGLLSKVIWLILVPIVTIFLLIDIDRTKSKILLFVPEQYRERTSSLAGSIGHVFGAYIRGLLAVALLYGIACGIAIAIMRVPYAVMLGAAAGVLSLVPYVGTISTVLLVSLVAFVSSPGHPMSALWAALVILALNQLFDNVINPKIVGKAVGIHPAISITALLIGAKLFGLMGMIVAVPIAASIQIVVLEFYPSLRGPDQEEEKPKPSLWSRLRAKWKKAEDGTETCE